jgi:DNA ligase-associated metallophosphoesterase
MDESLHVSLAGESLCLYAGRALYWPARQRLLVADLHLGKDDSFRAAGIALPTGVAQHDLERLSALIERSGAQSLWVLGDLLHGPRIQSRWHADWQAFRDRHAQLPMLLIEGNHDRAAAHAQLGVEQRADRIADGPFVFSHAPLEAQRAGAFGVCGHVHPVVRVPGLRGRFAAFALLGRQLILPAFSAFTGGWAIDQAHARYACLGEHLLNLGPTRDLPPD